VSWPPIELLFKTKNLWRSPAQFSVMMILAYGDEMKAPSRADIAALIGCSVRRVNQVFDELEALGAMERLGPVKAGGRNRFALTIPRALARRRGVADEPVAAETDWGTGVKPAASPPTFSSAIDLSSPMKPAAGERVKPTTAGDEAGFTRGMKPAASPMPADLLDRSDPLEATTRATHAAAPRLPFVGSTPDPYRKKRAVDEAARVRLSKLRDRVRGVARAILLNPALGSALLNGEVFDPRARAQDISALVEATKRLCAKRRIVGYGEVAHAVCVSEFFKFRNPDVINGTAPRPRDLARRRAHRQ
jgi:hypothetical protein